MLFLYASLVLAQVGTGAKQIAMKICGRRAPGAFNSACINMARAAICLAVSLVIWLCAGGGATTAVGHLIIFAAGLGTAVNLFTWILASRMVSLILIESVSMIGSLILPLILAPYLYAGDAVTPLQWLGGALVFVSVLLLAKQDGGEKERTGGLRKALTVLACAGGASVAAILKKYYSFHITAKGLGSIEYFTLINFATVLLFFAAVFIAYCAAEKRRAPSEPIALPYRRVWQYILLAGAALYVNELFTVYASQLKSAIYYPLSRGLLIVSTFLIDVIAFRARVTPRAILGLLTVTVAVVLVNL